MSAIFLLGGELEVGRLGLGAMPVVEDAAEGMRVLRRAVEVGVTALHPYPEHVVIATKGGLGWGLQERIRDGRPAYLRRAVDASLRRLRLERIDL